MLEVVGAVPVPSELMDRPIGLQTGLLDGSILMTDLHYVIGCHEFAKYSISSDFGCWANGHEVMNLELFNSLPEELQDIIEETAQEANRYYVEQLMGSYAWAEGGMQDAGVAVQALLGRAEGKGGLDPCLDPGEGAADPGPGRRGTLTHVRSSRPGPHGAIRNLHLRQLGQPGSGPVPQSPLQAIAF